MKGYYLFPALLSLASVIVVLEGFSLLTILLTGVLLFRIFTTRNKPIIIVSLMTGLFLITVTLVRPHRLESTIIETRENFTVVVKPTTVEIDGQFLRFTGSVINRKDDNEEVIITYKLSSEEEKDYFEENGVSRVLKIHGVLEKPEDAVNFRQFSYKDFLMHEEIFWKLNAEKIESQKGIKEISLSYKIDHLRAELFNQIDKGIGGVTGSYLKALLFSDKRELSDSNLENYRALGIIHLLSISGLHIQFLIVMIERCLLRAGVTKETTAIVLFFILPVYGIFAGFKVSVFRAIIQAMFSLGHRLLKRKTISLDNWSLTIILALLINPYQIYAVGFQLSYLLSCVMIILSKQNWIKNLSRIKTSICLSFLISLASIPVLSYHFYEFSWIVIILNLIFIPLFSLFLLPLLVFIFVLKMMLYGLFHIKLSVIFSDKIILLLEDLVEKISSLYPFTFVTGRLSVIGMILICCGILLVFLYLDTYKNLRLFSIFIIGTAFIFIGLLSEKYSPTGKVVMLDIGQGDAFLIKEPWGKGNYLIDTGGLSQWKEIEEWEEPESPYSIGSDVVVPSLKAFGIKELDQMILTHADTDHVGALEDIISEIEINEIVASKETFFDLALKKLWPLFVRENINIESVDYSKTNKAGPNMYILYPFNPPEPGLKKSKNNESLVLYGIIGNKKWLFTGDLESAGEDILMEHYPQLKTDVLKIGHHGSKSSTQVAFLEQLTPEIGWISSGKNNLYGHPNQKIIERLKEKNIKIYRTDQQGAVSYQYTPVPFTNNILEDMITKIKDKEN
ncbi:DNA internalization-related competence protein ComEC/Rec2 [Marinilactibacillus sp. 15R]|uniref:DNA internalization-related competence protein ComEC/Rec2 n=1 Tax=Marinilactibacillus sp. 15R TaxID=1911586 RepID=UPI0009097CFA|nr:DNA internalization-related competence protein ComEC/Rec2 [Marinilactibacillus sp. 15R]API89228.1 DNA internalization-related competence protein ComEC/Rec2 [Marinilactibacillus sp. 15R]